MNQFGLGLSTGILTGLLSALIAIALFWRQTSHRRRRVERTLRRIRAAARRRAQRLLDRANRLAEVGTLTSGLAHEIKNPLSTMQLNLQLLQEELDPNDPVHQRLLHRLATVSREGSRLRDILDDFLHYAGKIELRRQKVDLNLLLEELVDFFTPQTQLHHVQLRFKPLDRPLIASVDPRLIKQAVLNLMLNAMQAMPNGGELILAASVQDEQAIVDVIDTGSGIAPDAVNKIFQAYYSTKRGGTGLGLAMSHRIIEEHGGKIGVRSELGKGSDFFIQLPLGTFQLS